MALLEFRSPAAGGFFMMETTFAEVCKVLGKKPEQSGCWLPEDLPAIIGKIESEVEREKAWLKEQEKLRKEKEDAGRGVFMTFAEEEEEAKQKAKVSFAMRVFPMLEMLHAANRKEAKVMWGVPY